MPAFYTGANTVILPSIVRTATQVLTRDQVLALLGIIASGSQIGGAGTAQDFTGIILYLAISAVPGTDTVQLVLEEIDHAGNVLAFAACSATAAISTQKLFVNRGVTISIATTTGITLQNILPPNWRVRVVHSAASNFTYSLAISLINTER